MLGLGVFSPTFTCMLAWMMMFSLGTHMVMPITPVIGMDLSKKENYGARLGRYSAYNLSATIGGYAIVWFGYKYLGLSYQEAFIIATFFYVFAALTMGLMKSKKPEEKKTRFIFRKRYTLYYVLCVVNGARKQIFLTFAPWVLIQVFHLDPPVFAVLGVIISLVSILTRTVVGNTIDIRWERFILSLEAVLLLAICMGYAYAADFFQPGIAVVIIAACYIIDNSMSAVEMARSTYLRKIAVDPADVTPTLSTGISIDHVVSNPYRFSEAYYGRLLAINMYFLPQQA
jgi:predicted MFS family arabinose efflux permease